MAKCIIINQEITEDECRDISEQAYEDKPKIQKKIKRIISWKLICKECPNHKKPR